jgi:hypothetical protein
MATIERTAYSHFPKVLATRNLQACYTPLPDELEWARRSSRGDRPRLDLLVLLKVFQQMRKRSNEAVVPAVDGRGGNGYRMGLVLAAARRCGATFQGSNSSMRLAGCPAMRSST